MRARKACVRCLAGGAEPTLRCEPQDAVGVPQAPAAPITRCQKPPVGARAEGEVRGTSGALVRPTQTHQATHAYRALSLLITAAGRVFPIAMRAPVPVPHRGARRGLPVPHAAARTPFAREFLPEWATPSRAAMASLGWPQLEGAAARAERTRAAVPIFPIHPRLHSPRPLLRRGT